MTYPTLRGYDAWKTREPDDNILQCDECGKQRDCSEVDRYTTSGNRYSLLLCDDCLAAGNCPDCGEKTIGVICQACGFDANDYEDEE